MTGTQGDRGAAMVEYAGVLMLVSGIVGAVFLTSVDETVADLFDDAMCAIEGDCEVDPADPGSGDATPDPDGDEPTAGAPEDDLPVIDDGREPGEYQFGSFNMAGGNEGAYDPEGAAPALLDSLNDRQPAIVAVQEACKPVIDEINEHPDYTAVFSQVNMVDQETGAQSPASCKKNGGNFGTALIVRDDMGFDTDIGPENIHQISPDGVSEMRQMVCVTSEVKRMAACTTHLTSGDVEDVRAHETAEIQRILNEQYSDYHVILGGDLNAQPDSEATNNLYHSDYGDGANGSLIDASGPCGHEVSGSDCRDGDGTHGSDKIDYLFVSEGVEVQGTHTGGAKHSDHDLVWSDIYMEPED